MVWRGTYRGFDLDRMAGHDAGHFPEDFIGNDNLLIRFHHGDLIGLCDSTTPLVAAHLARWHFCGVAVIDLAPT